MNFLLMVTEISVPRREMAYIAMHSLTLLQAIYLGSTLSKVVCNDE
jgi:hypothetical protein